VKTRENTDRAGRYGRILTRIGLTVFVGFFLNASEGFASDRLQEVNWWHRNPQPTGQHLSAVVAGPKSFVVAGENGIILHSANGALWETLDSPVQDTFMHALYTGGEFTLTGSHGIITSPDGVQWTERTPAGLGRGGELIHDLDRVDDRWAVLTGNAVYHSIDGDAWDRIPFQVTRWPRTAALGPDRLVIGLDNGMMLVHRFDIDDGWVEIPVLQPDAKAVSVAYAKGLYVARVTGQVLTSADALSWQASELEGRAWSSQLKHTPRGWISIEADATYAFSSDGANWERRTIDGFAGDWYDMDVSTAGTWVGVGRSGTLVTSRDGLNWDHRDSGAMPTLYSITHLHGRWIAGGADGMVVTSGDGIHWVATQVGRVGQFFKTHMVGERVYLWGGGYCDDGLCGDGLFFTTDGINWTKTETLPAELKPVQGLPDFHDSSLQPVWAGDRWLLQATAGSTATGSVFSSEDGVQWERVLANDFQITSLYGEVGLYIAGDVSGKIHVSRDLIDWTSVRLPSGGAISSILGSDGLYLASATSSGGGIFGSTDGYEWERLPITRAALYGGSEVDGSYWFLGEGGTIIEVDPRQPAPLANLSVRTSNAEQAPPVIAGFVIEGSESRDVLVRAIGPGLEAFGVEGVTSSPLLKVYSGELLMEESGAWTDRADADLIAATAERVGAFPLDPAGDDAAIFLTLEPGVYTAMASGLNTGFGQRLVEVYDAAEQENDQSALINSSNRGRIEPGGTMVGGFVVRGDRDRLVLIRAVGPGLAAFGLSGAASDPRLLLWHDDEIVDENDDWGDGVDPLGVADAAAAAGAFQLDMDSTDAALVFQASPGNFTIHVTLPEGGIGGEVLLEVYYLDR